MAYASDALGLSGAASRLLRDLVHETLGLYFEDSRVPQLMDRLAPLVVRRGFTSALDYYYLLKYDEAREPEWALVSDALAVNETYFWREVDQLHAVVSDVVPELVRRRDGQPIDLWTVPCATGEEPLTLAMLLDQAGWFTRAPIRLFATDASPAAIERARARTYRERSMRHVPEASRERYFTRTDRGWLIHEALHRRVSWEVANLVHPETIAAHAGVSVVLCRNLFIYFSDSSMQKVVDRLAQYMAVPGYLCLGAAESLLRFTTAFELREMGGSFMYVREGATRPALAMHPQPAERL